jgi:hypothetical protein
LVGAVFKCRGAKASESTLTKPSPRDLLSADFLLNFIFAGAGAEGAAAANSDETVDSNTAMV